MLYTCLTSFLNTCCFLSMQMIFTQPCNKRASRTDLFNGMMLSWHILSRYTWNLKTFKMVMKFVRVETCVVCKLFLSPHENGPHHFSVDGKLSCNLKGLWSIISSILYLGSEVKKFIFCTVGFHGIVYRFAARSQELSSLLSEWQEEALRER